MNIQLELPITTEGELDLYSDTAEIVESDSFKGDNHSTCLLP